MIHSINLAKCGKGFPLMDFAGNIKHCDTHKMPCPIDYECIGKGIDSVCCKKFGLFFIITLFRHTLPYFVVNSLQYKLFNTLMLWNQI